MRNELIHLCEISINSKWNLVYRATEHGFGLDDFHSKCAGKKNCLTIVKAESGNVFGGYIDGAWNEEHKWMIDESAYLFSLINKDNNSLKIKCSGAFGPSDRFIQVYGSFQVGGGGNDLVLSADANVNAFSYSNLGNSYKHPDYALGSTQARKFLDGSNNFKTLEIEIYCEQRFN